MWPYIYNLLQFSTFAAIESSQQVHDEERNAPKIEEEKKALTTSRSENNIYVLKLNSSEKKKTEYRVQNYNE